VTWTGGDPAGYAAISCISAADSPPHTHSLPEVIDELQRRCGRGSLKINVETARGRECKGALLHHRKLPVVIKAPIPASVFVYVPRIRSGTANCLQMPRN